MRYCDFRVKAVDANVRETSAYFNKSSLLRVSRMVNFFENNFKSSKRGNIEYLLFTRNVEELSVIPSKDALNRIDLMSEFIYFEDSRMGFAPKPDSFDSDKNLRIAKLLGACQVLSVYYSNLCNHYESKVADKEFGKIVYKLIEYYNAGDLLDEIIYAGVRTLHSNDTGIKEDIPSSPDYDWSPVKEICLFSALLETNINNAADRDLLTIVKNTYSFGLNRFSDFYYRSSNDGFAVVKIVKEALMKLNYLSIPLETKKKMLKSLNDVLENDYLDEVHSYNNIQQTLEYESYTRPNGKCEEMMEKYKDKYKYKGIVYHGFIDKSGYRKSVRQILESYKNGFISCSKSLEVARNFALREEYDSINDGEYMKFGGVLEILIDEDTECLDIESLLKDKHIENDLLYNRLYNAYIKEKEVLIKLPLITFNVLHVDEVEKRLGVYKEEQKKKKQQNDSKMFQVKDGGEIEKISLD